MTDTDKQIKRRLAAAALCVVAFPVEAGTYQPLVRNAFACPSVAAWRQASKHTMTDDTAAAAGCWRLQRGTSITWDGKQELADQTPGAEPLVWVTHEGRKAVANPNLLMPFGGVPIGVNDLKTGPSGALLCELPGNLKEATAALGDRSWLDELGCFVAPPGELATRIPAGPYEDWWTVRYRPHDGPDRTLYGFEQHFTPAN